MPRTVVIGAPNIDTERIAGHGEAGLGLLEKARPTNDAVLREALDEAATNPELAPLVRVVESVSVSTPAPA